MTQVEGDPLLYYLNQGNGTFSKVTTGTLATFSGNAPCGTLGDIDNDGDLDLFVTSLGSTNDFFTNDGSGNFTFDSSAGLTGDTSAGSRGCAWGDYDNDGYLDLAVANRDGEDNFLYHNDGDGTFTLVATGPIVSDGGNSTGVAWGDYDDDGYLDLFIGNTDDEENFLYHNQGDGTFAKVTTGPVVTDMNASAGGSWGDYDNDSDLDLYVANLLFQDNTLYQNNGDGTFTKITSDPIVTEDGYSVSSSWGDYDNDGDLDLFVTNISGQDNFLFENKGDGSFTKNATEPFNGDDGDSRGGGWADLDNDGDLDIFVANIDGSANFL